MSDKLLLSMIVGVAMLALVIAIPIATHHPAVAVGPSQSNGAGKTVRPTDQEWKDCFDKEKDPNVHPLFDALEARELQWYRENPDQIPPPDSFRETVNGRDKYGLKDVFGNVVVKPTYDDMGNFSEGVAIVQLGDIMKDEKLTYSFIDPKGNLLFPLRGDIYMTGPAHETSYVSGLCPMAKGTLTGNSKGMYSQTVNGVPVKDDSVGFINKSGSFAISPAYLDARLFSGLNGIAPVSTKIGNKEKWGFIDTSGKCVVSFKYDEVGGSSWRTSDTDPLFPKGDEKWHRVEYAKPRMAIAYYLEDARKFIWYEVDSDGHEFSDDWSKHLTDSMGH